MKTALRKTGGFTLIEAIASITLLIFAITGPMALSAQSLRVSRDARLQLEATHLAEEGIEVVYNIRANNSADDAAMPPTDWMDGLLSECTVIAGGTQGCVVDMTDHTGGGPNPVWGNSAIKSCNAAQCPDAIPLYKNNTSGIFRQKSSGFGAGWTKTGFTRLVTMSTIAANRQVRVTSTVTYVGYAGNIRTVAVSADLYDWFPYLY